MTPIIAVKTLDDLHLTWYNHINSDTTVEIVNYLKSHTEAGDTIFFDIYTWSGDWKHWPLWALIRKFHHYPGLGHGFGLGIETPAEGWIDSAVAFWEKQMRK